MRASSEAKMNYYSRPERGFGGTVGSSELHPVPPLPRRMMTKLDRVSMAGAIAGRLDAERGELVRQWQISAPINHFVLDDVLPAGWAGDIRNAFPDGAGMMLKRSLRELKFVAAQMDKYHPLLEEAVYAFQAPEVVERVQAITALRALQPDPHLYAGGVSMMATGHFLNPHVDNSHDKFRKRYRVLNLLFYTSPDWSESHGGNLELWPDGPKGRPVSIVSRFNRLVVMVTHQHSWHSVSRNVSSENRCCVSNYYFSDHPVGNDAYFHVTSFRGRPEQGFRDIVLRADIWMRGTIRKFFPMGIRNNPHYYDPKDERLDPRKPRR
jgi:Rps23 Pro-64 3,4-dihydroxylase Tpa1-like proline 4-hydroxylase